MYPVPGNRRKHGRSSAFFAKRTAAGRIEALRQAIVVEMKDANRDPPLSRFHEFGNAQLECARMFFSGQQVVNRRDIYFKPDGPTKKAIVSVKGGDNVQVSMVRDLAHVVDREKAKIGVFITLAQPTGPMTTGGRQGGLLQNGLREVPENSDHHHQGAFRGQETGDTPC